MNQRRHLVLGFDSVHQAIAAEKTLKQLGIWCDLVPTPRELSSDCGMSIECLEQDLPRLESLRQSGRLGWKALYRPSG